MGLGRRATQQGGKGLDVLSVLVPRRIAGLELKLEIGPDAADRRSFDDTLPGQRSCRIGDPFEGLTPDACILVKDDQVNIDLPTAPVDKHEIPGGGVFCREFPVTPLLQDPAERRQVSGLDRDVQILVGPRLATKDRIDRPSSIDPDGDADVLELTIERDDVG